MQQTRLVLIGLLTLMQLLAPLVHAHAGGGQFNGSIHLPGLEFLSQPQGTCGPSEGLDYGVDVIVGLSPGLKGERSHAVPAPEPLSLLPVRVVGPTAQPGFVLPPSACPAQPASASAWLVPAPRAPPPPAKTLRES